MMRKRYGNPAKYLFLLAVLGFVALAITMIFTVVKVAKADEPVDYTYNELYRNQLTFSAKEGWNNDPNGLLYAGGVYHMYYQYNWDKNTNSTENSWGHMSWGHAVSHDLVRWEEKPVAIAEGQDGYGMMFSGSAIYDSENVSGLVPGGGILAFLTQPTDDAQRQILAYSQGTGGESFTVYGEILGKEDDCGMGDNEFRDPKVFKHGDKWLMAVGGGRVRMFSSQNLKDWEPVGDDGLTEYWGECPDISHFNVDGEDKYVLIISPEDKPQSHYYNKTNRNDTYYPAEYYVVGHLNDDGLFEGETPLRRLSQGIDSYAFQSFNDSPDGKVYGVSWAASWKTVDSYKELREHFNGGMTVVCELNLTKENGEYVLTRTPVEAISELRDDDTRFSYQDNLAHDEATGAYRYVNNSVPDVADINIEADLSSGVDASYVSIKLRESDVEYVELIYDVANETLTLDRSHTLLAPEKTDLYAVNYSAKAPLINGKLKLNILLDRAAISVFASGGRASYFSAIFPSVSAKKMSITSDYAVEVKVEGYKLYGIYAQKNLETDKYDVLPQNNRLYLSTGVVRMVLGKEEYISVSALTPGFKNSDATFTLLDGEELLEDLLTEDDVTIEVKDEYTIIKSDWYGLAYIKISYNGQDEYLRVEVFDDTYNGNVSYTVKQGGLSYMGDDGMLLATDDSDAFVYSYTGGVDFSYKATVYPTYEGSQAAGLVFGASDNFHDYFVATADYKQNRIKLWRSGVGDLKTVSAYLVEGESITLHVTVNNGIVSVYVPEANASLTYDIGSLDNPYQGGRIGLNAYNATVSFNDIEFGAGKKGQMYVGSGEVLSVVNKTDNGALLSADSYFIDGNGYLSLTNDYMLTLPGNTEYEFNVKLSYCTLTFTRKTEFNKVELNYEGSLKGKGVSFTLNDGVNVKEVMLGNKKVSFEQTGNKVYLEPGALTDISDGEQYLTVYTDSGRAEILVNVDHSIWEGPDVALIASLSVVISLIIAALITLTVLYAKKHKASGSVKDSGDDNNGDQAAEVVVNE